MKRHLRKRNLIGLGVIVIAAVAAFIATGAFSGGQVTGAVADGLDNSGNTTTPIKHVVVIFDENESFDHYFGTYPYAANTPGDGTPFTAKPGTPTVNGLYSKITKKNGPIGPLLTDNPNEYDPQRLTHSEALTSDQNHGYTAEENAEDNGKMDMVVQDTESSTPTNGWGGEGGPPGGGGAG